MLSAIQINEIALSDASDNLNGNHSLILEASRSNINYVQFASESIRADRASIVQLMDSIPDPQKYLFYRTSATIFGPIAKSCSGASSCSSRTSNMRPTIARGTGRW